MTFAALADSVVAPTVWASRFGDQAFAVELPADFGTVRRPWHGPSGAPLAFRFGSQVVATPVTSDDTSFSRVDVDGFAFCAASCHGEGSWRSRSGTVYLHDGEASPLARVQMLKEALFAACFARVLPRGGLLLHAATLWIEGRAFVVAGPSTAGKTTLATRFTPDWWSDEHAFLTREGDTWQVLRHLDFRGNDGNFPWRAPLAGLLWLGPERAQSRLTALSSSDAFERILPQALVAGPATSTFVLDAVAHLCQHVPVAELSHCLTTPVAELGALIAGVRRGSA